MREKIKRADIWQFLRFCLVGTLNTAIDFGVLNLLLWLYPTADTGKILEYNSIHETKKLPALTLMFDVDTVIIGAIKPVHDVDTIVIHAISKPKSSRLASDTPQQVHLPISKS